MAWDADRNLIYARRCQNFSVAMQNLAEEAARLRTIFSQELQSSPAAFVDTPIATVAEITTVQSYLTEFQTFHNGGGALADVPRGVAWTLPFFDSEPA